jgi:PAS domain S-box-containing protein
MNSFFSQKLTAEAEVRRVSMLFDRMPSTSIATLIGIFLCFLVLFGAVTLDILKLWAAYMLSVLAMRAGMWYLFQRADRSSETIYRWEWACAFGSFVSGLGWGALFGPLYPSGMHPDAQMFVALMVVITAFTGSVFVAQSNITFWAFIVPVLTPAIVHYATTLGEQAQWPVTAAACCIAVFIIVQRTLYLSATRMLNRCTQAESTLALQEAIFDSSPLGIAVTDGKKLLKCNMRLGELLGRRLHDLAGSRLDDHFVSAAEGDRFLADAKAALDHGHPAQGTFRLKRADGTEFWAELTGHRMPAGMTQSIWMVADASLRVANERRGRQRDPA